MDLTEFVMLDKFMNFIRKLYRENIYFSKWSFQIWWLIRGMEEKKCQISAQHL